MRPFPHPETRLAVCLLALGLWGCQGGGKKTGADAGTVVIGPDNIATAQQQTLSVGPRLSGQLEPRKRAAVRAEIGGSITEVTTELGQVVKEGQLLARVEDTSVRDLQRSAQSALKSAESDRDVAIRQTERTAKLVKAGALPQRDLEVAQSAASSADARVADARARIATVQKQLDAMTIQSPISGVVSVRAISQGDVVAPGTALFTVIDPSSMRLEGSVPSQDLAALSVGTPVTFQVRGYPDQSFEGKIESIAPAADPTTREIPILVGIPNPGGKLVSNLFAEGQIATSERNSLVIPAEAVDETGPSPTVTRVREGRVEKVQVTLGIRDDKAERVEIRSGLKLSDTVLLGSARELAPGTPVQLPSGPTSSIR